MKPISAIICLSLIFIASFRPCSAFEWTSGNDGDRPLEQLLFLIDETGADLMSNPSIRGVGQ